MEKQVFENPNKLENEFHVSKKALSRPASNAAFAAKLRAGPALAPGKESKDQLDVKRITNKMQNQDSKSYVSDEKISGFTSNDVKNEQSIHSDNKHPQLPSFEKRAFRIETVKNGPGNSDNKPANALILCVNSLNQLRDTVQETNLREKLVNQAKRREAKREVHAKQSHLDRIVPYAQFSEKCDEVLKGIKFATLKQKETYQLNRRIIAGVAAQADPVKKQPADFEPVPIPRRSANIKRIMSAVPNLKI